MSSISLSNSAITYTDTSATLTWSVYFNNSNGSWSDDPCYGAITFNGSTKSFSATFGSSSKTVGSASFTVTRPKTSSAQSYSCSAYFNAAGTSSGYMSTTSSVSINPKTHYTVSYNSNSGSGTMSASTKWFNEALTLTSNAFTKSDYTFQGWATSSGGSVAYADGASYTSNGGATLYAQWKKDITLSFNPNDGSGAPASETKSIWNSTTSATFTVPSVVPTKQYWKFTGWKVGETSTIVQPAEQVQLSTDTILKAQWVEDYIPPQYGQTILCTRSNGTTDSDTGGYGHLHFTWVNGSLSGQMFETQASAKYIWHDDPNYDDSTAWTSITNGSSESGVFDAIFGNNGLLADRQYDVVLSLQDTGYTANTYNTFISTELFTIDINEEGNTISFFRPASDDEEGFVVPDVNMYVEQTSQSGVDYSLVQILNSFGWEDTLSKTGFINTATNETGSIPQTGVPATNSSYTRTDFIPVKHSRYIFKTAIASTTSTVRIHGYDSTQTWVKQLTYFTTQGTEMTVPFDIDSADGIEYLRLSYVKTGLDNTGLFTGVIE